MSPAKVLLLSCIVMMHISFMASRPIIDLEKNLREITPACVDLRTVESNYTQEVFPTRAPSGLNITAQGISMRNTTEEIKTSICAIRKYLRNHMKTILSATLEGPMKTKFLSVIKKFTSEFEKAAKVHTVQCDITSLLSLDGLDDFKLKELGCQILSSVRQWVEHFSHKPCTE